MASLPSIGSRRCPRRSRRNRRCASPNLPSVTACISTRVDKPDGRIQPFRHEPEVRAIPACDQAGEHACHWRVDRRHGAGRGAACNRSNLRAIGCRARQPSKSGRSAPCCWRSSRCPRGAPSCWIEYLIRLADMPRADPRDDGAASIGTVHAVFAERPVPWITCPRVGSALPTDRTAPGYLDIA